MADEKKTELVPVRYTKAEDYKVIYVNGVYGGMTDKFPLGALMEKGLQVRSGQTHVQRYTKDLLAKIEDGTLDTTFLISHRLPLEDAARGYKCFREEQDSWTKVILKPGMKQEQTA